jgi:hypothetical protein
MTRLLAVTKIIGAEIFKSIFTDIDVLAKIDDIVPSFARARYIPESVTASWGISNYTQRAHSICTVLERSRIQVFVQGEPANLVRQLQ